MTGNSVVTHTTNGGTIQFTPPTGDPTQPASYKSLTTTSYVGENGRISMNTYLGTDGSPSDKLVVDGGAATGTTLLHVTNTTGPGALTVGNGILVVDSIDGGTTTKDPTHLSSIIRSSEIKACRWQHWTTFLGRNLGMYA